MNGKPREKDFALSGKVEICHGFEIRKIKTGELELLTDVFWKIIDKFPKDIDKNDTKKFFMLFSKVSPDLVISFISIFLNTKTPKDIKEMYLEDTLEVLDKLLELNNSILPRFFGIAEKIPFLSTILKKIRKLMENQDSAKQ